VQRGPAVAVHGGAMVRRHEQHSEAQAVHGAAGRGEGVGPTGLPQTPPIPEHKTARGSRGSTMLSALRADSEHSPSGSPLAHSQKEGKLTQSRKRRLWAKEAARNFETQHVHARRGAYTSRELAS
jgi:hypothetical protein